MCPTPARARTHPSTALNPLPPARSADDLATPYTNYTSGYRALLDYVWYDPARLTVTAQLRQPPEALLAGFIPSPIAYEGHYYFLEDAGFVDCLNAMTGAPVWRERFSGKFFPSPVAGDGKLYFANDDGVVVVIKAGPKYELLAKNSIGERLVASPAISQGRIFLRGEKHLWCIGEK